jgi:hypothetical protein
MHPSLLLIRIADQYILVRFVGSPSDALQAAPIRIVGLLLVRIATLPLVNFPVLLESPPHPLAHSLDHPPCPCSRPVARLRARRIRSLARPLIRFHVLSVSVHLPVSPLACLRLHALFIVARLPSAHVSTSPHLIYGCALAG